MAVGSYDANGIWQYGESDNISPISTTLNKLASSASSAFTSDRARLATLEAGSLSGMIPVKPVSVAVAGGTASVSTNGTVTFTAATSISLNGCFTAAYRDYVIQIDVTTSSGGVTTTENFRMRASGTDLTSAYYGSSWSHNSNGGSNAFGGSNNGAQWHFTYSDGTYNVGGWNSTIRISNPQVAVQTLAEHHSFSINNGHGSSIGSVWVNNSNSYDGFTIFPGSGTITGKITVYGLNQ